MSTTISFSDGTKMTLDDKGGWDNGSSSGVGTSPLSTSSVKPVTTTFPVPVAGSSSVGGGGSSGVSGGTAGYPGSSGSSATPVQGTGGNDSDWLSSVLDIVQTLYSDISGSNQQIFDQELKTKIYDLSENAQKFNQGIATKQEGLQEKQVGLQAEGSAESIAASGQNRAQSAVAFQQSQQDRAKQMRFMNALSAGIAQGFSTPVTPTQHAVEQPSPYIGTPQSAVSTKPTQLSSPTLSGTPRG